MTETHAAERRPAVWRWYVVFCGGWTILWLVVLGVSLFLVLGDRAAGEIPPTGIVGWLLAWTLFCATAAAAYGLGPFLPRRTAAWIYGIVLLAFASLGGCFVVSVPILVVWLRPATQAFFGRARAAAVPAPAGAPAVATPPVFGPEPGRPPVWRWYVVFCAVSLLLYLALGLVGVVTYFDPALADERFENAALAVVSLCMAPWFAVAPFVPLRPWAWTYGAAMLVLGMLVCCTLPAAIPLLVLWMNPETRAAFGRTPL